MASIKPLVPPEITQELTQILSNLVLGDNQIRSSAENAVNDRLKHTPEVYILALAQFALSADSDVMRSFSLVLLRRLLFRFETPQSTSHPKLTLYDRLSAQTLSNLERLLLQSLLQETHAKVRKAAVETTCELANKAMALGRPWHALQIQVWRMAVDGSNEGQTGIGRKEDAYAVFAGCPMLLGDLGLDQVVAVLEKGLNDRAVEVRRSALKASVAYLSTTEPSANQSSTLLQSMLSTLPPLLSSSPPDHTNLAAFLSEFHTVAASHPLLFAPHLEQLVQFLPALILPQADAGPTPTMANPTSSNSFLHSSPPTSFSFPPSGSPTDEKDAEHEARESARQAGLELMITLAEARPALIRKAEGWVQIAVRACLEGMGEIGNGSEEELKEWLDSDPSTEDDDTYPYVYEQGLDRLSVAFRAPQGGYSTTLSAASALLLSTTFQYVPSMLANYDWRIRHAGLMAIAAVAEGGKHVMKAELGKVVGLITPMFKDSHPRVRFAACQCVGQLCTDLEEVIQDQYHAQLFEALIPTLEDPEPRVHSHAAAALINFCEGVDRQTLIPYLDPIVERLLKLLQLHESNGDGKGKGKAGKTYVQEQAVTTLAMVADASETTFAKYYTTIMPLLLNVLQHGNGAEHGKLRQKAMECAGLIAIAVGRDVFRPDATKLVELLIMIQFSAPPTDPSPSNALLAHYLIATWAKICQALGEEFAPYLPMVMPSLLTIAQTEYNAPPAAAANDDDENVGQNETDTALEDKVQAYETLIVFASTLQAHFGPYVSQTLELAIRDGLSGKRDPFKTDEDGVRTWDPGYGWNEGLRESCAMLIPILLSCGKMSNTLTPSMITATISRLIAATSNERDPSFTASLLKAIADSLRVLYGASLTTTDAQRSMYASAMTAEMVDALVNGSMKTQLSVIGERRKERIARFQRGDEAARDEQTMLEGEPEDMELLEEMEDFALGDIGNILQLLGGLLENGGGAEIKNLQIAVGSVKEMRIGSGVWPGDEEA